MSGQRIEAIDAFEKKGPIVYQGQIDDEFELENEVPFEKPYLPENEIHWGSETTPTVPILRPQLTPKDRVNSLYSLIGFVNNLEELKQDLQKMSEEEIDRLSLVMKEARHDLHLAEKSNREAQEKMSYLRILKDVAVFIGSAATMVYGNSWEAASYSERFFKATTLGLTAVNLGASALERFDLIDNKYKNTLIALNFLSFGVNFYYGFANSPVATHAVARFSRATSGIVSGVLGVEEGKTSYESTKLDKKAFEHSEKIKQNQKKIRQQFDDTQFTEKQLQIEQKVAQILHDYQTMIQEIQRSQRG
ncbi:MAG: hypothetical protein ACOYK9_02005 [Chlamydiia bacterium]